MIHTFNQEDFDNLNLELSEVQQNKIKEEEKILKEVSVYYPAKLVFFTSFYDEIHHFERVDIYLKHDSLKLEISYNSHSKKFDIWCISNRELKNINYRTIEQVELKLNKPNKIGVLNKKKIEAWVQYWETVYTEIDKINTENKNEIDSFIKTLEPFNVSWSRDRKSGSIVRNGIKYSFSIFETYYQEKIELERYNAKHDLNYFNKISNNGLGRTIAVTPQINKPSNDSIIF